MAVEAAPLLEVKKMRKEFASSGLFRRGQSVLAVDDVSFRLRRGSAVALVGESGSGKSTVAKLLLRLLQPDQGQILLEGEDVIAREPKRASLGYRRRVQMIFQDPFGSLHPIHTVQHHLSRPLQRHGHVSREGVRPRALELLRVVGLEPAEDFIDRRPFELSGGQRQRVAIARALAVEPEVLVADEPTSMLDVSIRMDILKLLARLKEEQGLAILLITHDLASARYLADRVLVLFQGRVVEDGPVDSVIDTPSHPYTQSLLASIADSRGTVAPATGPGHRWDDRVRLATGCPFAFRCPKVMDACRRDDPPFVRVQDRTVNCHLVEGSPA